VSPAEIWLMNPFAGDAGMLRGLERGALEWVCVHRR